MPLPQFHLLLSQVTEAWKFRWGKDIPSITIGTNYSSKLWLGMLVEIKMSGIADFYQNFFVEYSDFMKLAATEFIFYNTFYTNC